MRRTGRLAAALGSTLLPALIVWMPGPAAAKPSAADLVPGVLSYLFHRACDQGRGDGGDGVEWPTFVQPERQPSRRAGSKAATRGAAPPNTAAPLSDAPPPAGADAPAAQTNWGPKRVTRCLLRAGQVWEALAAGALWATTDHAAIEADAQGTLFNSEKTHAAFTQVFGWEPPNGARAAGQGPSGFTGKQLQALESKLYLKPNTKLGDVAVRDVYDVVLRSSVTRFAREVVFIQVRLSKGQIKKLAKDYQAAAQAGEAGFYGPAWLQEQAKAALPPDPVLSGVANGRTLGTMLRRINDGSWGTVLSTLKKVLRDYDPELLKELGKNL